MKKTIEEDLPRETDFLHRHDQFRAQIEEIIDMPDRTSDLPVSVSPAEWWKAVTASARE